MKIRLPLSLALMILCAIFGFAQESKPNYRVSVNVSSKEEIKSNVVSYVSRELRALGDILIVDSEPQYRISIIAMRAESRAGNSMGYVISTVVTKHIQPQHLTQECEYAETLSQAISIFGLVLRHDLEITGAESLEKSCKEIVASIDGDVFEKERKEHQRVMDLFNKRTSVTSSPKTPKKP